MKYVCMYQLGKGWGEAAASPATDFFDKMLMIWTTALEKKTIYKLMLSVGFLKLIK